MSKPMQTLSKLHDRVMEIKDMLIYAGYVMHDGPEKGVHDYLWYIDSGLSELLGHIEAQVMAF